MARAIVLSALLEDTLVVDSTELPAKCRFDSEVVDGEYVPATPASAARILCRAPLLDVGVATVTVSLDGEQFSADSSTFTTLYAAKPAKAASRRLFGFDGSSGSVEEELLGLHRELLDSDADMMTTTSAVDTSFYGGGFYGAHGRKTMEDDELLFTEESSLLQQGLGSKPAKDFDVCAFAISPEYGPSAGHTQVTIGLAGSIPEDHTTFFCKFGDLAFKASTVTPPESGEGPTMITCTVPPQMGSERVVVRISPDGVNFSVAGPTFTYTANAELYGATTDAKFTYLPFSVDNCVFYEGSVESANPSAEQDEIAADAASIGEGLSGDVTRGFSKLKLSSAQHQQQHRRRRSLVSEAVSEAAEIAREENEIGEGISGALEGLVADDIASEEAAIGEGLSGEGSELDEIRAEAQEIGEGLSGATEESAELTEEEEIAAEEAAIGEGLSGHAESVDAAEQSERAEIEEEMRLVLEGVSGHAAAIKAADDMAAAPASQSFQDLVWAIRSADVGKALRYTRGLGMKGADKLCTVDGSIETMRAALSHKVAELSSQPAVSTVHLHSAICSLVDVTAVPAATWTSSEDILAFIEASFKASLKADTAAVADISTADCAVSILNNVLIAEEARAKCLHAERDEGVLAQLLVLPALVGRATLRTQRSGMAGLAAQRSVLTLVAAKVGGNSAEREPSFSARTGAHSCAVVVRDGPLPAGAEFDAVMYTFTGVTPLFQATRSGKGSLSALAVEYQGAPLQADVDVTAAAAGVPAELEPHAGLRLWADETLITPRTWLGSALASVGLSLASIGMVAKYALLPACLVWLVVSLRNRARPSTGLHSPLVKSEV
ncbi:hypothetical protein KFL_002630200 [Klebsormidium nitens]|uniref:IPT/TIG domain-containing protein n=1 Tax=Klebsormidium nitens TaxID=105231 RepID=A0A1Y1IB79_KLENI|nr:hypothetical protein KFL_002630200 [Klebsormidium nitens]|eukprot:GAQ85977.1 hypothetical protein KFL_002630200 [Klebsormidium nitens]